MKIQKSFSAKTSAGQAKFKTCPVKLFTMFNLSYLTRNSYFTGIIFLAIILFGFFGVVGNSQAATRIFYEDCENTVYATHFLEDQYGTGDSGYWNEFISEISQSTTAYREQYSMTYDPIITGNPHANMGLGVSNYGNLSNFDLSVYSNRYWYFRWHQRWEDSTYTGYVKMFYMGCFGDYYYIAKAGGTGVIIVVRSDVNGNILATKNGGFGVPSLDDEKWHKMEIFIDFGTAGSSNGATWAKVDGTTFFSVENLAFTSHPSPVDCVMWPSNSSGTKSGSQHTWLDELEIYTLDGSNDIPEESSDTTPPSHPMGLSVS